MTKYKEYFGKMVEANKELFDKFAKVHTNYGLDKEAHQEEINKIGADVLKVIHEWEGRLCSHSEKAGYANYTGNLAEKFQQEVKNHFPLIDHIGIIVKKSLPIKSGFSLKKISL
ncbi:hypothetical protein COX03_00710 [Candidatus Woesebacteria bacterium CG22_combo_CG10-13_8_21_14_all_39_10]|uniref:Uncharacterized protein n=1 Tax=Candidatus Woesebacteria bacterium CG22_combo_CG10-13_8_21_14_all_39_10 TaxID=1975059 RepID=A0A2H0BJN6_9BACT|nr:MAG: hypothetical protein COX03_00710 [Candidatus Woesebacteria bacterium CG22_combo_CG10-13_8_21_14_all_39_10]